MGIVKIGAGVGRGNVGVPGIGALNVGGLGGPYGGT